MSIFRRLILKLLAAVLFMAAFFPVSASAQNTRQVKGTVYDESGEPFPGVVIMNRKLRIAETTDIDGKFLIEAVPLDAVLTVEMMSYKTQEIQNSGK